MVCEPGRKSGYDRIGLLLQLAQIHAEYLGNRSFSREGAREKRARFSQKLPNLAAEIAAGGEPFIASSSADPVAILIPINIAVMGEHVAFHQCCPRPNFKAAWTLWNCATPFRQEGVFKVHHEVIANGVAPVTWSARKLDKTVHPLRRPTRKAERVGAGAARASSARHYCKGREVERALSSLS